MIRAAAALVLATAATVAGSGAMAANTPTAAEIVAAAGIEEWRTLDPAHTLYLQLPAGRVVIELADGFAPRHVANIQKLVTQRYFDGTAVVRVVGHDDVLRTLLGLQDEFQRHGATIYLRHPGRSDSVRVRFCYEFLFDPKNGDWLFPHDQIIAHMRQSA